MPDTAPPTTIRAGETISFVAGDYSAEDYSLQFVLNNGTDKPTVKAGVVDETKFTVTLPAPSVPGIYAWAEIYTKTADSSVVYGREGNMEVLPSLLSTLPQSFAAKMVEQFQAVLLLFSKTDKASVSYNGQSFSRASISEYQELLNMYEARLKTEQDKLTGKSSGGFIHVNFLPPRGVIPRF